jgi:membrane fusion protein, heavy metal efflux system
MNIKLLVVVLLVVLYTGCKQKNNTTTDNHDHATDVVDDNHNHASDIKLQYTAYTEDFEVFVEIDPLVLGHKSKILAHFTLLPDFVPLSEGVIIARLVIFGKENNQTQSSPQKKGIYSFELEPENIGKGELIFDMETKNGSYQVVIPGVRIYSNEHDAIHAAEKMQIEDANAVVFTKEKSWKIDFETSEVKLEPMGQVINTTAQIQSAPNDEIIITAATNGVVLLSEYNILEGKEVSKGQLLFSISGSSLAENNSQVRFEEARNNFELAEANYLRKKKLAKDKIVSESDFLEAKNQFDNARVIFNSIKNKFSSTGQSVSSPINGYIKQLLIKNGQYVEIGQPIVSITQNKSLFLHADVRQKFHSILGNIVSATIKTPYDDKIYTLDQLCGKIISYGRSTNNHNFLIPINLEIAYVEGFMPGSFVELNLISSSSKDALTIPNGALLENQGNYFVFVQITPELFEMREVKTGVTDGLRTEVVKGLTKNDRVVSKGAVHIKLARSTGALDAHSGHVH